MEEIDKIRWMSLGMLAVSIGLLVFSITGPEDWGYFMVAGIYGLGFFFGTFICATVMKGK